MLRKAMQAGGFLSNFMFRENIPLSHHGNYKIGGPAKFFFKAKNAEEVIAALERWRRFRSSAGTDGVFILGAGTNVLFSDKGFDGLILKPAVKKLEANDGLVTVGAGVSIAELLDYLITRGLSGLEWAGGLPGLLGGAVRGNAGAFGGEIKDTIERVTSLDIGSWPPKIITREARECEFDYRSSVFKKRDGKEIILEAVFRLRSGNKKDIRRSVEDKILYRQERHPMEHPNIGSIFKNVPVTRMTANSGLSEESVRKSFPVKDDPFPVVPAAYLISECGLKGVAHGGAMISPKHPNFIVNVLGAGDRDVKNLINLAKKEVKRKFGVRLEEEIKILD